MKRRKRSSQHKSVRGTRLIYSLFAPLYPLSSRFFHRRAHNLLMQLAGNLDGQNVLEVAAGSGELFRRILHANPSGLSVGVDLSQAMMAKTRRMLRQSNHKPVGAFDLQVVDARHMPYKDCSFDSMFHCYLLELLPAHDLAQTLWEFRRVLKPGGRMLFTLISDERPGFRKLYNVAQPLLPSFWGPLIVQRVIELLGRQGFRILHRETVRQTGYPSIVIMSERS